LKKGLTLKDVVAGQTGWPYYGLGYCGNAFAVKKDEGSPLDK
jgi:hypothetical protein